MFTAGQTTGFAAFVAAVVAFVLWHLTLVVTAGVPVAAVGVTLRALMAATPLTLRGYEPAGTTVTVTVFVVFLLAASAVAGWLLWRTPKRKPKTVGFADQQETKMSAGEQRARQKAAWTRRGSITAGLLNVSVFDASTQFTVPDLVALPAGAVLAKVQAIGAPGLDVNNFTLDDERNKLAMVSSQPVPLN